MTHTIIAHFVTASAGGSAIGSMRCVETNDATTVHAANTTTTFYEEQGIKQAANQMVLGMIRRAIERDPEATLPDDYHVDIWLDCRQVAVVQNTGLLPGNIERMRQTATVNKPTED